MNDFIIINNGYCIRTIGDNSYKIEKGQIFFYPQNQITSTKFISEDFDGYYVHFNDNILLVTCTIFLPSKLAQLPNLIVSTNAQFEFINQLLNNLYLEYTQGGLSSLVKSMLLLLIEYILEKNQQTLIGLPNINRSQLLVNAFKELHNEHQSQLRSVSYYAEKLNVSVNHLNKCTKNVENKTATELIQSHLFMEASILLNQSSNSIAQIAQNLGFEDANYFSKFFRKMSGQYPSEYRKND